VTAKKAGAGANEKSLLMICDSVGRLLELWGFRRNLGRIWALLYLRREPLGAAEIGSLLGMSRGSTSMALQELIRWGVIRKSWKPGERKDFFEAEEDVAKVTVRVLREREIPAVEEAIRELEDAESGIDASGAEGKRLRKRTADLLRTTKRGRSLIRALADPRGPGAAFLHGFAAGKGGDR